MSSLKLKKAQQPPKPQRGPGAPILVVYKGNIFEIISDRERLTGAKDSYLSLVKTLLIGAFPGLDREAGGLNAFMKEMESTILFHWNTDLLKADYLMHYIGYSRIDQAIKINKDGKIRMSFSGLNRVIGSFYSHLRMLVKDFANKNKREITDARDKTIREDVTRKMVDFLKTQVFLLREYDHRESIENFRIAERPRESAATQPAPSEVDNEGLTPERVMAEELREESKLPYPTVTDEPVEVPA